MADINSSQTEDPSETKTFNRWSAFWFGIGILGLLLLAGINWFAIQPGDAQVQSTNQKGWTIPANDQFFDLAVDPQGKVWGLHRGIVSFDVAGNIERIAYDNKLKESGPMSLAFDSKGRIWVGTEDGAVGMREINGEWKIFTLKNHIDDARIYDIVLDGQDRAWITIGWFGTSGLSVIDPASDAGSTYTPSNSGISGTVTAVAVDQQGHVWCVNEEDQLMVLRADGNWEKQATLPDDSSTKASLAIDQQGLAWVGSNGKVYHLEPDNQWTTHRIGDQGVMNTIETIAIDHQGRVWAGSYYQGVFMFDEAVGWTTYDSENSGLNDDSVNILAVDGENKIWIVTSSSLIQFDTAVASSPFETNANREAAQKLTSLKNRSPIIAFAIVLITILGVTLSTPQALGIINLPNFMIGFLGWFLVFGSYWGIINAWASGAGAAAMAVLLCLVPPLPASLIAVIVLMIRPRWRWIGAGILLAQVINSIGYILFKEINEFTIWELLACVPFFLQGL